MNVNVANVQLPICTKDGSHLVTDTRIPTPWSIEISITAITFTILTAPSIERITFTNIKDNTSQVAA